MFYGRIVEILIDWSNIKSENQFYDLLLSQLKAPDWHGRNLDALADSLITGAVNAIEPPYTLVSINTDSKLNKELKSFQFKALSIFVEAAAEHERQIKVWLK